MNRKDKHATGQPVNTSMDFLKVDWLRVASASAAPAETLQRPAPSGRLTFERRQIIKMSDKVRG